MKILLEDCVLVAFAAEKSLQGKDTGPLSFLILTTTLVYMYYFLFTDENIEV